MTAGRILDGPLALYKMPHPRNTPQVGDPYLEVHVETTDSGFEVRTARGTVASLDPLAFNTDDKEVRRTFSTRAEANAEFDRCIGAERKEGFR